jgi:hypothetical protein
VRASLLLVALLGFRQEGASDAAPAQKVDFVRDVLPVLKESCWSCHGEKKVKGSLRLDSKALAMQGGISGPVIVPGKSKESRFVSLLVTANEDDRMPQKADPLAKEKIELLRAWVDQGAEWPEAAANAGAKLEKHWAYVPPVRRDPPAPKDPAGVRNPIDAFLAAALEEKGLRPRPEAPKAVLLRRLTVDLLGVPPAPAELRAFLDDASPDAYEKAVDRLLADPRHAERWARHWMDVWRYSDWAGFNAEVRESQPHVWRWRDWIVESLQADKPYDRMIVEMIAGDELAPLDADVVRATGFLVRNWQKFSRDAWLQNTVEHTSKAFLATTMNCARCHSHFFDPISHEEYYRFRAIFEPHQVRTDALPGQADTAKDGLARAYDGAAAPTYIHVRGNEKNPDKSREIQPGVPRALGGPPFEIRPVTLPRDAWWPARRDFVRRDLVEAGRKALEPVRQKAENQVKRINDLEVLAGSEGKPAPEIEKARGDLKTAYEDLPLLLLEIAAAEAKQAALEAVVAAERLEDEGRKPSPDWDSAAQAALAAQRKQAHLEAKRTALAERRTVRRVKETFDRPGSDQKKVGGELEAARKKLAEAEKALSKAEAEDKASPSTAFSPRTGGKYFPESTGRRLALARWIADARNPLTARVAVNHVWMRHFGKPIVPTVFEFGNHGRPPSHPALLDWLATELVREGWSLRRLHRLMVTSAAYRRDSSPDAAAMAADPENRLLWRMNVRRMEAEAVRDSVLSVAGHLDLTRGGPDLDAAQALTVPRRSLYFRHAQEKQAPFLLLFDAPSPVECYERPESVVPQQALALANSTLLLEKSRVLAAALSKEGGDFVEAAFLRLLGRAPSADERKECGAFLESQAKLLAEPAKLRAVAGGAPAAVAPSADPAQRAREGLVHVLFNHNDFVTIR